MIHQIGREFNNLFTYVTCLGKLFKINGHRSLSQGELDWLTRASRRQWPWTYSYFRHICSGVPIGINLGHCPIQKPKCPIVWSWFGQNVRYIRETVGQMSDTTKLYWTNVRYNKALPDKCPIPFSGPSKEKEKEGEKEGKKTKEEEGKAIFPRKGALFNFEKGHFSQ